LVSVAHSYVSPKEPEYREIEPHIVKYEYDPRRAIELIGARGYARDAEGAFRDTSGERLSLEIRTTAGDDLHEKAMFATADAWQRVGIDARPVASPRQRARDLEYRATFPGFELARQPNELSYDALTRLHGAQTPLPETSYVGRNRMRYRNAELDRLIDQYLTTIQRTERIQPLGQIMRHMTDQVVPLGLFYDAQSVLVANRIRNVVGGSAQGTYAWNAHEWEVRS
jgi:peptide/nickel transport system substrate-binding protein